MTPAAPTATPDEIKDVNTRYHDAAASSTTRSGGSTTARSARPRSARSCARRSAARRRSRSATPRDRRRAPATSRSTCFSWALIERATATDISPGHARARSSASAERSGSRSRPSAPRPSRCPSPMPASTSSSATRSFTTSPTWSAPSRSSPASCARAERWPSAASPRATATASRRCRSAPAACSPPLGGGSSGAAPAPWLGGDLARRRPRARVGGRRPRLRPGAAARIRPRAPDSRRCACAARSCVANVYGWSAALARGDRRAGADPVRWRMFAYRSYIALQRLDAGLLEPRLPPSSSTTSSSAPASRRPSRT